MIYLDVRMDMVVLNYGYTTFVTALTSSPHILHLEGAQNRGGREVLSR